MLLSKKNLDKKKLKIIVTDSGLGGLSVHALLDKHLRSFKNIPNIEIIFFNSLADHSLGYNVIKDDNKKLRIFNNALKAMLNLNPDIILIACNTLSALYPKTKISKSVNIPIISIIDLGIEMVLENIMTRINEIIIIFGTGTTIKSNKHKVQLIKQGVDENKIITQACKNLESEIQINPNGNRVAEQINNCIDEAFKKDVSDVESLIVVLACTHYGYSYTLFEEKLFEKFKGKIKILNPNEKMGRIIKLDMNNKYLHSEGITNKVLSHVDIGKSEMNNIILLLRKDSPSVAEALENYIFDVNLFEVE